MILPRRGREAGSCELNPCLGGVFLRDFFCAIFFCAIFFCVVPLACPVQVTGGAAGHAEGAEGCAQNVCAQRNVCSECVQRGVPPPAHVCISSVWLPTAPHGCRQPRVGLPNVAAYLGCLVRARYRRARPACPRPRLAHRRCLFRTCSCTQHIKKPPVHGTSGFMSNLAAVCSMAGCVSPYRLRSSSPLPLGALLLGGVVTGCRPGTTSWISVGGTRGSAASR